MNHEENLNDLELARIDFDWVEKQTKPNFLKKALKLLELDGNFYPELSNSIQEKLKKLDPKYKFLSIIFHLNIQIKFIS